MTVAAELEAAIARTPGAVFAELVAVERYPEWLVSSGIRTVEQLDGPPLRAGARLRIAVRVAGVGADLEGTVTAFEQDRRLGLSASDARGVTMELEAQVSGEGSVSRLRWSIRLSLPLRYRFFESMAAPQVRAAATADLGRLRQRLEAVAS